MTRQEESHLLKVIRAGKTLACERLVRTHYRSVYRFLYHLARDVHTAEDLTQETFANVWTAISGFRQKSSLKTWIHRIAYSKFVDWRRRCGRDHLANVRLTLGETASRNHPGQTDRLLADERSALLQEAVQCLKEEDHLVIVLHYFQGLSFGDMAKVLEQPAGTIKWRVSQALKCLRLLMDGRLQA